ncbi:MAG: hypothetical protein ACXV3S_03150, partial [Kineosporiaceae bacterium]
MPPWAACSAGARRDAFADLRVEEGAAGVRPGPPTGGVPGTGLGRVLRPCRRGGRGGATRLTGPV